MIGFPTDLPVEKVIDVAARCARSVYIQLREFRAASYTLNDNKFRTDNLWRTVAERCVQRGVPPGDFVTAISEYYMGQPFPNTLLGAQAFRIYEQWTYSGENARKLPTSDMIEVSLKRLKVALKAVCSSSHHCTHEEMLTRNRNQINHAAFLWCVAKVLKVETIAEGAEYMAAQFFIQPVYREVYSRAFPALWPAPSVNEETAITHEVSHA